LLLLITVVCAAFLPPPPLGVNTWNSFRLNVNAQDIIDTIDAFVKILLPVGYEYVNIDDGWAWIFNAPGPGRYPNGTIWVDNATFPNGIASLASYANQRGVKLGIYTDRGPTTCAYRHGSLGYEAIDAQTYADWGCSYLKEDSCYASQNHSVAFAEYQLMETALRKTGKEIFFSLCGWAAWYAPAGKRLGNSWRISNDVNSWSDCEAAIDINALLPSFATHGHYNDPDMLVGSTNNTASFMTPTQSRTQFSLWCIMMAPLLIGGDIGSMSAWDTETYTNKEMIAVNQDARFVQGVRVVGGNLTSGELVNIWAKPLLSGARAVLFLNNDANNARNITCDSACFQAMGFRAHGTLQARNLWTHRNLPNKIHIATGFTVLVDKGAGSEVFLFQH